MQTTTHEIADGIHRLSTFVEIANLPFNQYLVVGEEGAALFHTGMRGLFPTVSEAAARIVPLDRLRWIAYGHFEADECGALTMWLEAAPSAEPAQGLIGVMTSLNDTAVRPPRVLADGDIIDLGSHRLRWLDTPHVPHGWDAGLLYEERTGTLLCGDLFTQLGAAPPTTESEIVSAATAAEDAFSATAVTPSTAPTMRRLAALAPTTLALMHGPAYRGDGGAALRALADDADARLARRVTA